MNVEQSAETGTRFLRFDRFMAEALYGPDGFFVTGGRAGGSDGDFLTSPETGGLFGRMWGRAFDQFWDELGRPDPFVVIEAGAGVGTLARSVLKSQPACRAALSLHLVEASQPLAEEARKRLDEFPNASVHQSIGDLADFLQTCRGAHAASRAGVQRSIGNLADLQQSVSPMPSPERPVCHVLCSNELFDNLPCGVVRVRDGVADFASTGSLGVTRSTSAPDLASERSEPGTANDLCWEELALVPAADPNGNQPLRNLGPFTPTWVPLRPGSWAELLTPLTAVDSVQPVPLPTGIEQWVADVASHLDVRKMLHVDYGAPLRELQTRNGEWIRTYRAHGRAGAPWDDPGTCDITVDVPTDLVSLLSERVGLGRLRATDQSEWLASLGIDSVVEEAKQEAQATAAIGGLDHLRARSLITEAGLLTDPSGLGQFQVLTTATAGR